MKIATIIVRVFLGLAFTAFGIMILFDLMKAPPLQGAAAAFKTAVMDTGYMKVVGALQFAGGLLLLIGRYVPLGLTLLGPVIANILCYHIFIDHAGLPIAVLVSALALFLLWRYRANFAGLVKS
jgi:putative oxidoreductase